MSAGSAPEDTDGVVVDLRQERLDRRRGRRQVVAGPAAQGSAIGAVQLPVGEVGIVAELRDHQPAPLPGIRKPFLKQRDGGGADSIADPDLMTQAGRYPVGAV